MPTYKAKGSGYFPANTKMEGGTKDTHGNPLLTLQDFLKGNAEYVSCAMDKAVEKKIHGRKFSITELDKKYGKAIEFRVVDTGGAFKDKGYTRIDICTASSSDTLEPTINGWLTLVFP